MRRTGGSSHTARSASTTPETARTRNAARQPTMLPRAVPTGAPMASPRLLPLNTMASALPTLWAGTIRATNGAMADHSRPCAMPPTTREPMAAPKSETMATRALLAAKNRINAMSRWCRGTRDSSRDKGITVTTMMAA